MIFETFKNTEVLDDPNTPRGFSPWVLDKNKDAIEELNEKCDLLIVTNPFLSIDELLASFSCKYVLCNNLHGAADDMRKNQRFREIDLGVVGY